MNSTSCLYNSSPSHPVVCIPISQYILRWFCFLSMESYPSKMNHGTESNEKKDDRADSESHIKIQRDHCNPPKK